MNLIEFFGFLLLVVVVIFCSRQLGRVLGMPAAALVIPIIGLFLFLLRWWTRTSTRTLLILAGLLIVTSLLSIAIAHVLSLREPIVAAPGAAGIIFIAVQSKLLPWQRVRNAGISKR